MRPGSGGREQAVADINVVIPDQTHIIHLMVAELMFRGSEESLRGDGASLLPPVWTSWRDRGAERHGGNGSLVDDREWV